MVALLQKQDLLDAQIISLGETLNALSSSSALKVKHQGATKVQREIKDLNGQYNSLLGLSKNR